MKELRPSRAESLLFSTPIPFSSLDNPDFFLLSALDKKTQDLYRLFSEEEKLIPLLADDHRSVDSATIHRAVAVARQLAEAGYPTGLIPLDEMLDIIQTGAASEPGPLLNKILSSLDDQTNSAWTARVAAALAYFSKPES